MQIGALGRGIGIAVSMALLAALSVHGTVCAAPLAGAEAKLLDSTSDDADTDDTPDPTLPPTAPAAPLATGATPAKNTAAQSPAAAGITPDTQRAVKDAAKPIFEELSHSAVAEALRSLDTGLQAGADSGLDSTDTNTPRRADPSGRQRNWDGSASERPGGPQSRTGPESETDKVKASVMLRALIDDVKPWALAAAALYLLGHLTKAVWGYRRRTKLRKMERRKHHRRRV